MNINHDLLIQLVAGAFIGVGAGYIGSFMVLRKMSLVGDALSHVALPGIAIALLLNIHPFLGAFAALFIAVIGIWLLEKRTNLPSETLVGILFTSSLAIGLLLTPGPELLEALFGDITRITSFDLYLTIALTLISIFITYKISKKIVLNIISKDLSASMGVSTSKINFIFILLVATIVALGLKVAGTLLMGSLVIIPAAAAKNISLSLKSYNLISGLFGFVTTVLGILIALNLSLQPGPIVVLVGGCVFLITLIYKR